MKKKSTMPNNLINLSRLETQPLAIEQPRFFNKTTESDGQGVLIKHIEQYWRRWLGWIVLFVCCSLVSPLVQARHTKHNISVESGFDVRGFSVKYWTACVATPLSFWN
jgi:hypothetical protein